MLKGENNMTDSQKIFEEKVSKGVKLSKKVLFLTFLLLGIGFLIASACIYFFRDSISTDDGDPLVASLVFVILGGVFVITAIVLRICIPEKYNYERYKHRLDMMGGIDIYSLFSKVENQSKDISKLQSQLDEANEKILSLQNKVRILEQFSNQI